MNLKEALNIISLLSGVKTNIFSFRIRERVGIGKSRIILDGKTLKDITENKDFLMFESYYIEEIEFLSGNCYIYITKD